VSPDDEAKTKEFLQVAGKYWKKDEPLVPPFPILLDSKKEVAKEYHILTEIGGIEQPIPSTFIIDKQGRVKFKYIAQDYGDRPDTGYILEILKSMP
jgi:peroxiredoxin